MNPGLRRENAKSGGHEVSCRRTRGQEVTRVPEVKEHTAPGTLEIFMYTPEQSWELYP